MSDEIKGLIEAQGRAFEEFKSKNDAALAGKADAVVDAELKKLNAVLDDIGAKMREIEVKAARPGAGSELDMRDAEYKGAFESWARTGEGERELKALQVGVGADGGFSVPTVIDNAIGKLSVNISPMRSVAQVISIGTPNYSKLVDVNGTTSGWVGETASRSATNTPQFAKIAPTMGTLYAFPQATQDSLEDSQFNLESWLAMSVVEEFARAEGAAFISGNGTDKPTGFLTGTPVATADATRAFGVLQFTAGGSASVMPTTLDPIITLIYSMKAAYRAGSVFMCSKAVVASLRTYKDSTGQYLWQPSVQAGVPATFMGYPVIEAEDMPAVAANAFPLAFGNFGTGYLIVDRRAAVTLRDPYSNKPYVGFYTTKRVGGIVQNSEAIKLLKISA